MYGGVCVSVHLQFQNGQKRAADNLEPKLKVAVSHNLGAENGAWVLGKSNKCS